MTTKPEPHDREPKCPVDPKHPVSFRDGPNGKKKHQCDTCLVQTCHYDCGHASAMNPHCRPQKRPRG